MKYGTNATRPRAFTPRLLLIACLAAALGWALVPSGAVGQSYELPTPPPPAPPSSTSLPLLTPFPIVRIVGRTTKRGARITRLTVRAAVGTSIVSRCIGRGCPYAHRTTRIAGTRGQVRTIHVRGFERSLRAGVLLRVYAAAAGRTGKFTSFRIRKGRSPRRNDGCVADIALRPVRCPAG